MAHLHSIQAKDSNFQLAVETRKAKEAKTGPLSSVLEFMLSPVGFIAKRGYKAISKGIEEYNNKMDTLNKIVENPDYFTPEAVQKAKDEIEAMHKGVPDTLDYGTEEAEKKIKKVLDVGEEEEEEEKGRWDKYYREREDRDPYEGFEDRLREIYGENWREILERSNV